MFVLLIGQRVATINLDDFIIHLMRFCPLHSWHGIQRKTLHFTFLHYTLLQHLSIFYTMCPSLLETFTKCLNQCHYFTGWCGNIETVTLRLYELYYGTKKLWLFIADSKFSISIEAMFSSSLLSGFMILYPYYFDHLLLFTRPDTH